jgi:TatD related DNase
MNSMGDRRGCPCCSFDIFLPECTKAPIDDHIPNILASKQLPEGNEDVPCSPQEVFALLHALANKEEDDIDSQRQLLATLVVDTHGHAQLNRERDEAYAILPDGEIDGKSKPLQLISLACAVEPSDWQATLDYASSSTSILPGLGVHPWYLAALSEKKQWLADLESLLLQHPNSLVAEIGLCKMAVSQTTQSQSLGIWFIQTSFR